MNPNEVTYDVDDIGNIRIRLQYYSELVKKQTEKEREDEKENVRRNDHGN